VIWISSTQIPGTFQANCVLRIAPFVGACAGGWGQRAACGVTSLIAGELLMELTIWKYYWDYEEQSLAN
jgi:hypothetical protein